MGIMFNTTRGVGDNKPEAIAMRAIFVSYRRDDAEGEAGRLFDDLVTQFGEDSVFMDVAAIEVGRDFRKAIDDSVATCGVLLAVIGKEWIDAKNEAGQRRLDDPFDFVRLETASALKRDIPVVPVLVHGAKMPRADQLPDDLKELAYRNGVELTHARWNSDLQLLIKALRPHVEDRKNVAGGPSQGAAAESKPPVRVETKVPEVAAETSSTPRRKPLGIILALVAAVLVVGTVVAYMMLMPKQVTVPDLSGNTLSDATAKLQALNLTLGQKTSKEDSTKVPNIVLSQSPWPNAHVKTGSTVDLVFSQPPVQPKPTTRTAAVIAKESNSLGSHMMIVSDRDTTLAINAWGGAQHGTTLRLYKNCPPDNPACTWSYHNGMIISDQDPTLAINAWGGAQHGTVLRLYKNCPPDNPACTWTYRNGMLISDQDPTLAINAYQNAKHGGELVLYKDCPPANPDCTWSLVTNNSQ